MPTNTNAKAKLKSFGRKAPNSKSGHILHFKLPKQGETTIKAKFKDDNNVETTEITQAYSTSNNYANLVALMSQIVSLGDLYELWEGNTKQLAQTMSQALNDQVREEWKAIISQCKNWEQEDMKAVFMMYLRQFVMQIFGPTAFKTQCRAMENGEIRIPENDLRTGT